MSIDTKDEGREAPADLVGQEIGKYHVVGVVGRGGMGCVYEAINTSINKHVALKLIDSGLARNAEANARFQREALAASAVDSPYIVQIFDAGATSEGVPYIVMELLRGEDLGRFITERGRIEVVEALQLTAQILKGLHHAHGGGIVHRDLKPDNVFLVDRDDEPVAVKLLDFGVSKIATGSDVPLETLTRQGTVVGTPYYMSPEQAQAFPDVDGQADLYSAGAILYECLTGRPPHVGKSYEQVIVNICMKDADDVRTHNPAVPEAVAELLKKALSREREDRYGNAREMLEALVACHPEGLRTSTPSANLRLSDRALGRSSGALATPKIITGTGAEQASGLADTVTADTPAPDSTEARRPSTSPTLDRAVSTVRSADDNPLTGLGGARRWLVPLAAVVALGLVAVALFSRLSSETAPADGAQQSATETASTTPNASAPSEQPSGADAAERGTASPSASELAPASPAAAGSSAKLAGKGRGHAKQGTRHGNHTKHAGATSAAAAGPATSGHAAASATPANSGTPAQLELLTH